MDALQSEIRDQVTQVRAALRRARDEHDDYLVDIHQGELDGLARTAAAHGLALEPDAADVLAAGSSVDLTSFDPQLEPAADAAPQSRTA